MRTHRPYTPGGVFHLTSRTIRHVRWFENPTVADGIVRILRESIVRSDAQLLAWTVMPTHYHLIVRQGSAPLSRLMRRLNHRIARLVQGFFSHEGHVFERRFRDVRCGDAAHLRNAIVYVHRNPVEAGLCEDPAAYRWSSHRSYFPSSASGSDLPVPLMIPPFRLFACFEGDSTDVLCERYAAYAAYLDACKRLPAGAPPTPPPRLDAGDRYWTTEFCKREARTLQNSEPWRPDLADLARSVIRDLAPGFTIEQLLMRRGGKTVSTLRHEIIRRATRIGFRGVDIARYLHISPTTVCKISAVEVGRPAAQANP